MRNKMKYLCIGFALLFNVCAMAQYSASSKLNFLSEPQFNRNVKVVMQDNELEPQKVGQNENIYSNPLLLNGKTLDYGSFTMSSRGLLSVAKGNPQSAEATLIPFYVSIRRNGTIVESKKMLFLNKPHNKINLSEVFPFCKDGDLLIIKPVRAEDWKAKRILKLLDGC